VTFDPPERFNIADYFLEERLREGRGGRTALVCGERRMTYAQVSSLSNRFGNVLRSLGAQPEQRVIVALPDSGEYVGALFGILKIGCVVVMVNPHLPAEEIGNFFDYSRAPIAVVHRETLEPFARAAREARHLKHLLVVGPPTEDYPAFEIERTRVGDRLETFPSHRDDAAIWLFSGGTTGRPKAVAQTHLSFANTTELYAKGVIGYRDSDVTLSVPKLYFGYATGSNLFFPFAVGGTSVLFPERSTADAIFDQIRAHRPTILVNVPTMINHMVLHPDAARQDLSCLRLTTSAGEALPVELYQRWMERFGVEILDGLGTAEMWHIFISNRPGDVRPGTLGRVVPGFEIRACDDEGREAPRGETGWLWVRGRSRAIGYWQQMEKTAAAFRGEWYVTGDLVRIDAEGYVTYEGRGDDMLKVGGKWLAPAQVENCLRTHPAVHECAVVGVRDASGLVKPHAYVVARETRPGLAEELQEYVKRRLEPYKYPREVIFLPSLPRTHLGKVDRGRLRAAP
jgi:benzoate-CoA ligase family protein